MSIELKEGDSVGLWFLSLSDKSDWLCHLGYEEREGKRVLIMKYRFRHYEGKQVGNPFEDEDRKSWYQAVIKEEVSEEKMIATIRGLGKLMAKSCGNELYEIMVDGDFNGFMKKFMDAPFAFSKQLSKEEYEKEYLEKEKK